MLHLKSKIKEIEYYIQQVEMLAMNKEELSKISKIMKLKELISDSAIRELISEDLKDERWIEETNILINTCNKRQIKSFVLQEHINQCKNFIVFRYIEDKLLYAKEIKFLVSNGEFQEVDVSGKETQWVNSKFHKSFEESNWSEIINQMIKTDVLTINLEWLHKNRDNFYSSDIFEDIDFLIKKKKKTS